MLTGLCLTRREGQTIVIGDPANPIALVSVATIKGDRIRLVVKCDRDIPIHRQEVADEILSQRAAKVPDGA